jgi:hypothetical protein
LVFDGNWNSHLGSKVDHNQKYSPLFDLFVGERKGLLDMPYSD